MSATPALSSILYVEDDADIRTVVKMTLETLGQLTVHDCESGREAVERAADIDPDLILLDVMMPDMDGRKTLAALREIPTTASTPVVFMTARVQSQDIAEYRELGAIDVIYKPFDPMRLVADVQTIWLRFHERS